ncbi:MAG: Flp family type IVb pilin [Armatimonadia bacterium]
MSVLGNIWLLWADEAGITTVEYALLLAFVSVAAIAAWQELGRRVSVTIGATHIALPTS